MPNYQNSMIYKLCCNDPNITDSYVGSTLNFKVRKSQHKTVCNNQGGPAYNYNVYQFIRGHGGFENWSMILIENFPCDSKLELHKRERYWLEQLGATLNKNIPSRTPKEQSKIYYQNHNEQKKIYYQNHKEELKEKGREKITCECGTIHNKSSKGSHLKSKKHQRFLNI